MYIAILLYAVV